MKKLPLFYFSPTICFVDDDTFFLNSVKQLFKDDFSCLSFTSPQEAITFFNSYQSPSEKINFIREFKDADSADMQDRVPVDINISSINQLMHDKSIKNEIGILIIDNNMPNLNGIDVCLKLQNLPFKKILLTGGTRAEEVVGAFNDGIIDKFIPKDNAVVENILTAVTELTYQFFYEKTQFLLSHLEASRLSPLSDPVFVKFFLNWCDENHIQEYYLINRHGSFLVKNKMGATSYFVVMSEYAKNEFYKLNDDALDQAPDLFSALSRGEMIPFFGLGKEHWQISYSEWDQYFYPCRVVQGRENYYWVQVEEKKNDL